MRNILIFLGLLLILLSSGCAEPKPKVNDSAPKKVISTYLEGYRDNNPEKIYSTVSAEVYKELQFAPEKLQQMIENQDKNYGKVQSWSFTGEPYMDQINNQAILQTLAKTTKTTLLLEFDIRKYGDNWFIYNVKSTSSKKDIK